MELTKQEKRVLEHLVDAWNDYLKLDVQHNDEVGEFRHGIHSLQAMLALRTLVREYKDKPILESNDSPVVPTEEEPLTVKALITQLQAMPQDKVVGTWDDASANYKAIDTVSDTGDNTVLLLW